MKFLSLWQNLLLFLPAAAAIGWAGTLLERDADVIARRTGLGAGFTGMLLLAAATSLPELATTVTAVVVLDNPTLAVHNLLGGVALQTALLVVADASKKDRGALTFFSPRHTLLTQGVGLLLLLQIAVAAIATSGRPVIGSVSVFSPFLALAYLALLYLVYRQRGMPRWTPSARDDVPQEASLTNEGSGGDEEAKDQRRSLAVGLRFAGAALLVLAAGWLATTTAETLAVQTGQSSAFMGATLLALATSMPELSTTIAASRRGRYTLAISNVFGSNAFDVVLLVFADALFRGGSIFERIDGSVALVPMIGGIMTCVYIWGLLERDNRTLLRVGVDSLIALVVYAGGMTALYMTG